MQNSQVCEPQTCGI